jgi:GntR family transcriptional regulator / MocR family aminotransferase
VLGRAEQRGVGIYGISGHYIGKRRRPGVILGFARLNQSEIREGVSRLRGILQPFE